MFLGFYSYCFNALPAGEQLAGERRELRANVRNLLSVAWHVYGLALEETRDLFHWSQVFTTYKFHYLYE